MSHAKDLLPGTNILKVSIPLILLVVCVSAIGLLYPEIYRAATPNWLTQSVGQDAVDLFLIVPVLIIGTLYSFSSNRFAAYVWVGTLLYLVYTFLIYCFTVRFNPLFLPYCLILGLSFFSLLWFFSGDKNKFYGNIQNKVLTVIGFYFVIVSGAFYWLWLNEIIPAMMKNEVPASVIDAGLMTNPVHVIDLALFLPATFIVGIMALRRTLMSTILSPVLLTFFILMDLTIAALSVIMKMRDAGGSYVVAIVMLVLSAFSVILFIRYAHKERLESMPVR